MRNAASFLDAAFRRFEAWFDDRLAETIEATRGAIDTALLKRREHADRVRDDLARLQQGAELLTNIRAKLS